MFQNYTSSIINPSLHQIYIDLLSPPQDSLESIHINSARYLSHPGLPIKISAQRKRLPSSALQGSSALSLPSSPRPTAAARGSMAPSRGTGPRRSVEGNPTPTPGERHRFSLAEHEAPAVQALYIKQLVDKMGLSFRTCWLLLITDITAILKNMCLQGEPNKEGSGTTCNKREQSNKHIVF